MSGPAHSVKWPLQMETIYIVEIPEGNENRIRHVCDSHVSKYGRMKSIMLNII